MKWRGGLGGATIVLVLAGAAVALGWLQLTSGRDWLALGTRVRPGSFVPLLAVTTLNVLVRFIRWQYLLRRVGVRIATRPSLLIYVASLTAIATPAYVGELLRSVLVRRRFGVPLGRTVPVLLAERALDVFTLALVTAVTVEPGFLKAVTAGLCGSMILAWGLLVRFVRTAPVSAAGSAGFAKSSVMAVALMLSALAWAPTGWLITLAANAIGVSVPVSLGLPIFARATLLGGLSLMPAGIGATGSVAIIALTGHGLSTSDAISVVSVLRLSTVGITLAAGLLCLVLTLRRATNDAGNDARAHFDDLADEYDEQLPAHIRDLLIARKTALVSTALGGASVPLVRGLDLGCGQGAHAAAMNARGYRVVGVDVSVRSVARARRAGVNVVAGSALDLPFASGSFDFVYAIGVLHHVPEDWRARVRAEVLRVLKPSGRLLVHETNPRNPLFRFYMGYVFPIARRIDEGTEQWLDPDHGMPGMTAIATEYMTFLPDFLPRWMLSWSIHIERWLERSRWRRYAVHYLKVFERNSVT